MSVRLSGSQHTCSVVDTEQMTDILLTAYQPGKSKFIDFIETAILQ